MPPTAAATKVKDPEYSNWLKVSLALYYLTVGLHSFIQGEVDAMHQFLLHKLYRGSGVPKPQCSSCKSKDVKQNRNTYVWKFKSSCPSHLCDIWLAELLTLYTNPTSNKIYWDNCDVTAWPFVPWECAKLYMPRGQLPANTGPVKCDSQALLTLMANCKYFHGKLSPAGLRLTHMVSKIRNSVMHSEEMRLSDGVSKSFIQDITSLLEDPTHLKSLEECKLAVNEINKIVNDSIDVFFNVELEMIALTTAVNAVRQDIGKLEERASDSVESLKEEYIQLKKEMRTKIDTIENRVGIVENRQDTVENDLETMENRVDCVENRIVTVENDLETMENRVDCVENRVVSVENRQNTVLNDLETMEKRVDCVENRVVTVENRQDTVENRVVTVENRQSTMEKIEDTIVKRLDTIERDVEKTQQQQVELSQAISASVAPLGVRVEAEEKLTILQETGHRTDINKLRGDLIKVYKHLRCVQVSPIYEMTRCPEMDNVYVDLVLETKQDSKIKVTSYKQIFLDGRGLKLKRVYLRGKGGLGKTTFCRRVLHAWCNAHEGKAVSQDGPFQDEAILQMFDILFYMNLREVSVDKDLIEVLCDKLHFLLLLKSNLETLLRLNGDKILFILDGLDEMIVKAGFIENIVIHRDYPDCCFLVSSRPWKISQMELQVETEIDLLLDLRGFSERNAIKFAENIFRNCYNDGNVIQQFEKDIENNKLAKQLIHVPLLLVFLTHCWYDKRSLPTKLHELYISFLNMMADRLKEKYKKDPNRSQMDFRLGDTHSAFPKKFSETSLVVKFGEQFLLSLCGAAHHFLLSNEKENSLVFEETELLNALGDRGEEILDVSLKLGLLSVTDSVSYLNRKLSVSFLHKTMQEFFTAACFILSPDKLANFTSSLRGFKDVQQNENIILFLVGLMPELGNSVLEKVNELYRNRWERLRSDEELEMEKLRSGEELEMESEEELDNAFLWSINRTHLFDTNSIYLRCKEEVIGENVQFNVSCLCLEDQSLDLHWMNPAFL